MSSLRAIDTVIDPHIEYTPSKFEMKMFREMEDKYVSENERKFFEAMRRKIQTECASLTETIIDYDENPDGIYLYREIYDDFRIGRWIEGLPDTPVMTNGLFGLLSLDMDILKAQIILSKHIFPAFTFIACGFSSAGFFIIFA